MIEILETNDRRLGARIGELEVIANEQRQRFEAQWLQIEQVYNSTSWRITWPVRFVGGLLKGARLSVLRNIARQILHGLIKVPVLHRHAKWFEARFPGLAARTRQTLGWQRPVGHSFAGTLNQELSQRLLSPRANLIYTQLVDQGDTSDD
jgi:hypothetical protein